MRPSPCRLSRIFEARSPLCPTRRRMIRRSALSRAGGRALGDRIAEQPMRQRIEFAGDAFEDISETVGNRVDQPGKNGSTCQRVALIRKIPVDKGVERG